MPEQPVNSPLSADECVHAAFDQIDQLLADEICELCALKLVCREHGINYQRLLVLYLERRNGRTH